jgi:hypothetical protein
MECKRNAQGQTSCNLCIANNQQCEFTLALINEASNPAGRNYTPQDKQMHLLLIEQLRKEHLLMAQTS